MPLYEYVCMAHGNFERLCSSSAATPKCPQGCSPKMVRKLVSAPAILSDRTKNIDATLRGMAKENGLTDMNNRGGEPVFKPDGNFMKAQSQMERQMLSGQTYAGGLASGDNAIPSTLQNNGFVSDNAMNNDVVRAQLTQPKPIVHASWNGKS